MWGAEKTTHSLSQLWKLPGESNYFKKGKRVKEEKNLEKIQ